MCVCLDHSFRRLLLLLLSTLLLFLLLRAGAMAPQWPRLADGEIWHGSPAAPNFSFRAAGQCAARPGDVGEPGAGRARVSPGSVPGQKVLAFWLA